MHQLWISGSTGVFLCQYYDKITFHKARSKDQVCKAAEKGNLNGKDNDIKVSREESLSLIKYHLHSQAGELCKILYTENFILCSDEDKNNITDKEICPIGEKLEKYKLC